MRTARRIVGWLGVLVIVLLVGVAVLFAVVQTAPGKRMLAGIASHFASTGGMTVAIEDISGFVPTNMTIGRVVVADATGPFAEVDGLSLAWRPLSLLSGTIDVQHLGADRISLERKPVLPPAEPSASTSGGSGIPVLKVVLGDLAFREIVLGEAVAGMPATLSLTASARLVDPAEGLTLDFALARLDSPGEVRGRVAYAPNGGKDTLDLDVTASEPAGGLVARLAQIEGLPAISLSIKGSAPLDDWNGKLLVDAGTAGRIEGTGAVRSLDTGRRAMLDIGGSVAGLVPAMVRPLFADHTTLIGSAVIPSQGPIQIEGLNLSAAGFGLALVGALDTSEKTADLAFDVVGGDPSHFAALAPGVSWTGWRLHSSVKGALAAPTVAATLTATDLSGGGYGAGDVAVQASTSPQGNGLAFAVNGVAKQLSAQDPKVAAALGRQATFAASGALGPNGTFLDKATVNLAPVDLTFAGRAAADAVQGTLKLGRLDLTAFSAFAGRPLSGTIALDGTVDTGDRFGNVALDVKGTAKDVTTGVALADGFFKGETRIQGAVSRSADGSINVQNFKLAANGLDLTVDGGIEKATADLTAKLALADLGRLDSRVSGGMSADLRFSGGLDALGLNGTVSVPSAKAMDKTIEKLQLAVDLSDLTGKPAGSIQLDGRIAGKPAVGSAKFATGDTGQRIDDLDFAIGDVRATGAAGIGTNGIVDGRFTIAASNLADLSALILTDISGRLDATVVLDAVKGVQRVAVNGKAQNIVFAGNRLASADIDARVVDPAGTPILDGKATLAGLVAGSQNIEKAVLTAKSAGSATDVTLDTAILGASLSARANITPAAGTTRIRLDALKIVKGPANIALSAPATISIANGGAAIDRLVLATGNGGAAISGSVGRTLDLTVDLRNLPLTLVSVVSPALDMQGTLSGNARIGGTLLQPTGNYDLKISRLSTGDVARQGVGPFDIAANGTLGGGLVRVDASINGPSLSGLTIRGSVPIAAGALDLRIAGAIDLAIANTMLATSGSTLRGKATIDASLRGSTSQPSAAGTIRIAGGTFTDSVNGVTLTNIQAVLTGTDRAIQVTSLSAQTPGGGSVSGSGNVSLDVSRGMPASIQISLTRATLVSSELVRLVTGGRITIEGPVMTRPKIGGRLDISRLDVNIPDKMPGGLDPLDVRHINTRGQKTVADTSLRARARDRAAVTNRPRPQPAFVADLDLAVSAPNGVFVRGMGIDAEFGGDLILRGTTANPVTLGGFELRRGQFSILGRRLEFTQGKVSFEGSTDPVLDFTASTTSSDVTANINVTGRGSAPGVSFTSSPTLPPDEILSRILFGKSISTLNASQALQVAQAIAQFSGGGPGVLDSVRRSLGVDSLDVDTTGTVGIGKRLNDRVYIGAKQGPTATSGKVTVDVDVTRNIRLQGAAGADGSGEVGLGAQWDY